MMLKMNLCLRSACIAVCHGGSKKFHYKCMKTAEMYNKYKVGRLFSNSCAPVETSVKNSIREIASVSTLDSLDDVVSDPCFIESIRSEQQNTLLHIALDKIQEFSDQDILRMMDILEEIKFTLGKEDYDNNKIVFAAIETISLECIKRFKKWSVDEFLVYLRKYYTIYNKREDNIFVTKMIPKFWKKMLREPPNKCCEYFYYISAYGYWRSRYFRSYLLELFLVEHFENMGPNQVALFLEGFVKREYRIVEPGLLEKLYEYLGNNAHKLDAVSTGNFVYTLSRATLIENSGLVYNLFDSLHDKIDVCKYGVLHRVLFLASYFQLYESQFYKNVLYRYLRELKSLTIIDMMYTIVPLIDLNYSLFEPHIFEATMSELKTRSTEICKWPRAFVYLLNALTATGVYDYNMINKVLSTDYLISTYNKRLTPYTVSKVIFSIHCTIDIMCSDYNGTKLDEKLRKSMVYFYSKYYIHNRDREIGRTTYEETLSDIKHVIDEVLGDNCAQICLVLPHLFRRNIIFALDSSGSAQKLPEFGTAEDIIKPTKEYQWYCVLVIQYNQYSPTNHVVTFGANCLKEKQLPKLGYEVLKIVENDWSKLTHKQKRLCVEHKIASLRRLAN